MKLNTKTTAVCGLLATFALSSLSPVLADSAGRQNDKNNWRNLGFVSAAIAGIGLLEHNQTATLIGAAGAAYSANRYEQDRHIQSQRSNDWSRRYHWNYNDRDRDHQGDRYNQGDRDHQRDSDARQDWHEHDGDGH